MANVQLQIGLSGNYSVLEFRELLSAVETLYNLAALPIVVSEFVAVARNRLPIEAWQRLFRRGPAEWFLEYPFAPWLPPLSRILREMPRVLGPDRVMMIKSIHLESPGDIKIDLGLAEVAKELREWFRWLTDGRTTDRLENLERKIQILREVGYSEEEIRKAMLKGDAALDRLLGFARQKKLLLEKTSIIEE